MLYDPEEYNDVTGPNGGVLYLQNAEPDGPVAWMMFEVIDRVLRWIDDDYNITRKRHGIATWCNTMDQDGLMEALTSSAVGEWHRIANGGAAGGRGMCASALAREGSRRR